MKKIFNALLLLAIATVSTSCATIFTKSSYPINFNSNPSGANITVATPSASLLA